MAIVLGMHYQYSNMPRWSVCFIMPQSKLPKQMCKSVSHVWRNPTRGSKHGKRYVWILVLALANWTPSWNEVRNNFPSLCFFFPHVGFLLLLFSFGFLPMPHSLLVQMDFFTHAIFFLGWSKINQKWCGG